MPKNKATEQFLGRVEGGEKTMQVVVVLNFIASMAISFSLNYLWGMINAL